MKNIVKSIIFLIILCIGFIYIFKILWISPTSVSSFYEEPNNSLDVVYIGASNAYVHFNTVLAYNLYGYTTGLLSADSLPLATAKNLIKESEKTQHPSLYIVDLTKATDSIDSYSGAELRKTIDSMKFSLNRIDTINEVLKYKKDITKKDYIDYYFSFFMYHNKWKKPTIRNIIRNESFYKGYLFEEITTKIQQVDKYNWVDNIMPLQEETKQILNSLMDYIKLNNLNVLFVIPTRTFNEETNMKLNSVIEIIHNNNFKVINFNTLDVIDWNTDFYNTTHLNVYGSTKYTLYFAKYLNDNYHLENHKNDNRYNSWNQEYERFKLDFKTKMNKDFDELLLEYSNL